MINYFLLGQEGQGLCFIHCGTGGKGCTLIFFPSFFGLLRGRRGVEVDVFIFPFIGNVEGGGGKGVNLRALEMFFSLWRG